MGFNEAYRGTPPWDIGEPQPEFIRLVEVGWIRGKVLDVGCGTGENALYFASKGLDAWGADAAPRAIARGMEKAEARGLKVHFTTADALHLGSLRTTFDAVTDSGLFHVFDDEQRPQYRASLEKVLPPGGRLSILAFSDQEPEWGGPRRLREEEFRETFEPTFRIIELRRTRFKTTRAAEGAHAWLARLERTSRRR